MNMVWSWTFGPLASSLQALLASTPLVARCLYYSYFKLYCTCIAHSFYFWVHCTYFNVAVLFQNVFLNMINCFLFQILNEIEILRQDFNHLCKFYSAPLEERYLMYLSNTLPDDHFNRTSKIPNSNSKAVRVRLQFPLFLSLSDKVADSLKFT